MAHALVQHQSTAAVLSAVAESIKTLADNTPVPPGHAFELYCPIWPNLDHLEDVGGTDKKNALKTIMGCKPDLELNNALYQRSRSVAHIQPDTLSIPLTTHSALITGSGTEHPTENGFSFLRPYGVPFVAGSGVKGTLRAAAEYEALFEPNSGWRIVDVWYLFGWEAQADYWGRPKQPDPFIDQAAAFREILQNTEERHAIQQFITLRLKEVNDDKAVAKAELLISNLLAKTDEAADQASLDQISFRGLLNFWDLPLLTAECAVDIMTPHYSEYYNGKASPHDGLGPTPISMLVVKPGAKANLTIQWSERALGMNDTCYSLKESWKSILEKLVHYTIKWNGFGAKTAVGYGRFTIDETTQNADEQLAARAQEEEKAAAEAKSKSQRIDEIGENKYEIEYLNTSFTDELLDLEDLKVRTNDLIREATESWPLDDRTALHNLAIKIYKSLPKVGKKPKAKRDLLLSNLLK